MLLLKSYLIIAGFVVRDCFGSGAALRPDVDTPDSLANAIQGVFWDGAALSVNTAWVGPPAMYGLPPPRPLPPRSTLSPIECKVYDNSLALYGCIKEKRFCFQAVVQKAESRALVESTVESLGKWTELDVGRVFGPRKTGKREFIRDVECDDDSSISLCLAKQIGGAMTAKGFNKEQVLAIGATMYSYSNVTDGVKGSSVYVHRVAARGGSGEAAPRPVAAVHFRGGFAGAESGPSRAADSSSFAYDVKNRMFGSGAVVDIVPDWQGSDRLMNGVKLKDDWGRTNLRWTLTNHKVFIMGCYAGKLCMKAVVYRAASHESLEHAMALFGEWSVGEIDRATAREDILDHQLITDVAEVFDGTAARERAVFAFDIIQDHALLIISKALFQSLKERYAEDPILGIEVVILNPDGSSRSGSGPVLVHRPSSRHDPAVRRVPVPGHHTLRGANFSLRPRDVDTPDSLADAIQGVYGAALYGSPSDIYGATAMRSVRPKESPLATQLKQLFYRFDVEVNSDWLGSRRMMERFPLVESGNTDLKYSLTEHKLMVRGCYKKHDDTHLCMKGIVYHAGETQDVEAAMSMFRAWSREEVDAATAGERSAYGILNLEKLNKSIEVASVYMTLSQEYIVSLILSEALYQTNRALSHKFVGIEAVVMNPDGSIIGGPVLIHRVR